MSRLGAPGGGQQSQKTWPHRAIRCWRICQAGMAATATYGRPPARHPPQPSLPPCPAAGGTRELQAAPAAHAPPRPSLAHTRCRLGVSRGTPHLQVVVLRLDVRQGDKLRLGHRLVRLAEHALLEQQLAGGAILGLDLLELVPAGRGRQAGARGREATGRTVGEQARGCSQGFCLLGVRPYGGHHGPACTKPACGNAGAALT